VSNLLIGLLQSLMGGEEIGSATKMAHMEKVLNDRSFSLVGSHVIADLIGISTTL
jgi:hypothetical protein